MNGVIYMYTSPSGKQYIGQTFWPSQRKYQHKKASCNTFFHKAIKKYGFDNFLYTVIHSGIKSRHALNTLEKLEIRSRMTMAPNGYNLTSGGDAPELVSIYTRKKMSLQAKNRSLPGRRVDVVCIETGERFPSMKQAADKLLVNRNTIARSVNNGTDVNGLHFCRYDDFENNSYRVRPSKWKGRPVQCYETGEIFPTAMAAIRGINSALPNSGSILRCLDNPNKTSMGYHWVTPGTLHKQGVAYQKQFKDTKRKVECIERSEVFNSIKSAAEFVNLKSPACICTAIKRGSQSGGYHWRYVD